MSAINLQHEIQFEFIRNEIKEVTTKIKRHVIQKNLKHATKVSVANMAHSQTDELIDNMLKKGMVCRRPKKGTLYLIFETTNDGKEKTIDNTDVNTGNSNCFPRCINLPSL